MHLHTDTTLQSPEYQWEDSVGHSILVARTSGPTPVPPAAREGPGGRRDVRGASSGIHRGDRAVPRAGGQRVAALVVPQHAPPGLRGQGLELAVARGELRAHGRAPGAAGPARHGPRGVQRPEEAAHDAQALGPEGLHQRVARQGHEQVLGVAAAIPARGWQEGQALGHPLHLREVEELRPAVRVAELAAVLGHDVGQRGLALLEAEGHDATH
mmetsp:Transcript_53149/g.170290  ORF Transcript_53149/g.170290 Transcript_53149/m.170290 type:complete len:213 (-) Transcript_53149:2428-3066(-)